ncbi:Uncharacterised protein [Mycobacteroides abscessus subsp. massiliense]|uniref:hypothetical protein n=1 Tax=Mycobacteroides abscessus TaxID=36809 RepID=UPI00092972C2|nr:hypothetical protein [Mycobacteroides abscessus]QSM04972.1 ribbon-helix-turn-helix DNA binding domain protein [Mycobacterium phage prophiGD12-2]MBN7355522.1 hypothetical protein [Mycobacteroides abscessus subsp. abscessus]MBN7360301.1 hypothetical protein [Mycobacteroides abscessus subsp. abscessus]MBN7476886.1 hypothetical protein [Mycobacteroides abscessus subsp. abscessus]SIK65179.1 Uncharacterised protein [Mycobacteroides abscessus subsp. abscessus]
MATIQTVVPDEFAAVFEEAASARGLTVSSYARQVLMGAVKTDGTFFGVVMCRANSEVDSKRWFAKAMPYAHAEVVDGALIFRNPGGRAEVVIAPGRWRECSRRLDVDRDVFDASVDLE